MDFDREDTDTVVNVIQGPINELEYYGSFL